MSRRIFLGVLLMAGIVSGTALLASAPPVPTARAVHGHYVVLAGVSGHEAVPPKTVPLARIVIDAGFTCPTITGSPTGQPIPMVTRENPHSFPVMVCEAVIGFDQTLEIQLTGGALSLPTVRRDPSNIVVFGDTGCKAPKPGKKDGCPVGTPAEPFATLASAAATDAPDLVLHMGDYNYRGTGGQVMFTVEKDGQLTQEAQWTYDAGDGSGLASLCEQEGGEQEGGKQETDRYWSMNAPNSNNPDSWQAWNDDFFSAAGDLLAKAPWVVARGNHELCSRAGPGWFYFLDPHSNLIGKQLSCPEPDADAAAIKNVVLTEPYAVDLGSLSVLVLDSANACDALAAPTFTALYEEQFRKIGQLAPKSGTGWLISHRPLWGVTSFQDGESTTCSDNPGAAGNPGADGNKKWGCINKMLQAALKGALGGSLPTSIDLLLAGHMHRFQSLTFSGDERPPLVVMGNGGVALEDDPPVGSFEISVDGEASRILSIGAAVSDQGTSKAAFGYLEIDLDEDGAWTGVVRDPPEALTLTNCGSAEPAGAVCQLAPGVRPPQP